MTVETSSLFIDDLRNLDTAQVTAAARLLATLWRRIDPEAETEQGALSDLVVWPNAIYQTALLDLLDKWRRSTHLLDLASSSSDIDDLLLEYTAGNYRIDRQTGQAASGQVMVIVSVFSPFAFQQGAVFTADGVQYTVPQSYAARLTVQSVFTAGDRLLTPLPSEDGMPRWGVLIEVTAAERSASANLEAGTALTPQFAIPNFVRAYAYSSISNGLDDEDNASLASRAVMGITVPQLSGRANMSAALRRMFPSVLGDSVIGFGDLEMTRDRGGTLPLSVGGHADWYVKTSAGIIEERTAFPAVLVEKIGSAGVRQITLNRDAYPGFYALTNITHPETFSVLTEVTTERGYDLSRDAAHRFLPDIPSAEDAAFTAYQTATVRFFDDYTDVTDLEIGTVRNYTATIEYIPLLTEIQDWVSSDANRPIGCNILVKAPVPCRVNVNLTLVRPVGTGIDIDAIKQRIAARINSSGFTGYLSASLLTADVQSLLPAGAYTETCSVSGRTQLPDGTVLTSFAGPSLEINAPPSATGHTACFYTSLNRINVTVRERE
jgi:hypothetical protein